MSATSRRRIFAARALFSWVLGYDQVREGARLRNETNVREEPSYDVICDVHVEWNN
jgi:hypothetical protein